jgi:DNA repair exonuclease SbcCD ATPase subunit
MAKKTSAPKKASSRTPAATTKLVDDLVEQRQQDAAAIASLQEREAEQVELFAEQDKLIKELRAELAAALDQRETEWQSQRAELEQSRRTEGEKLAKQLRESLRYDEQLEARRADVKRLDETVERLAKQVAELTRTGGGTAGSGAEPADAATLHRLGGLEQSSRKLARDLEAQESAAALVKEAVQKQLNEASRQLDEVKRSLEDVRTTEARSQQRMTESHQRMKEFDQFFDEWRAHKQLYEQQYQRSRQVVEKLEALQSQLASRQNEIAEIQRIGAERVKGEWDEWRASAQETLRGYQSAVDEQWRHHERRAQELKDVLDRLVERADAHQELLSSLIDLQRAQLEHSREAGDALSRADRLLSSARAPGPRRAE